MSVCAHLVTARNDRREKDDKIFPDQCNSKHHAVMAGQRLTIQNITSLKMSNEMQKLIVDWFK